ncbi:MAG: thiamine pyrophosphate-dependent enzyme [Actinomycetota bacterium]|nr:thiamine pyrophosphate-dependent enzyme [Actinomycetota bacterium]
MKKKVILTGNEAIARGAYEAGVKVATAYPGTPSTEILETISKYKSIYSQWSVNEKVAMEVASGASIAGARSLVAMKHVGLNVAADPFMTLAYTGVGGGLVIVSADDPDLHSSQNEQDNRYYSKMAKIPMLEPSDSQECKDFTKIAFEISEKFDTPVLLRTTTRISHSGSVVELGEAPKEKENLPYLKDAVKYVMIPAHAKIRHKDLLNRWERLRQYCNSIFINSVMVPHFSSDKPDGELGNPKSIGIITSGVCFQFARETFDRIPILKLGITSPFPEILVRNFLKDKDVAIIIEELSPFIQEQVQSLNIDVEIIGKEFFPENGELNTEIVKILYKKFKKIGFFDNEHGKKDQGNIENFKKDKAVSSFIGKYEEKEMMKDLNKDDCGIIEAAEPSKEILPRLPVLCAGCSHRAVFYVLKKLKLMVMGDIGCYTLAVLPPISSLDSTLCMGAGIGQALGVEKADPKRKGKVVSVIGDSTFFHSGITSLIDNVFNKGTGLVLILDNRITAMTGHQTHPGLGETLMGKKTTAIKPEDIAVAVGVKSVKVINSYDIKKLEKDIKTELLRNELSVIVCRQECVLTRKNKIVKKYHIDQKICKQCGLCIKYGCPAIKYKDNEYGIDELICNGCGVCANICPCESIKPVPL